MSDDQTRLILAAIAEQGARVEALRSEVAAQNVAMARLETEVKLRACPNPGVCNDLMPRVIRLEGEVRSVADLVQQVKGARMTLAGVVAVGSLLSGALGAKIISAFTKQ